MTGVSTIRPQLLLGALALGLALTAPLSAQAPTGGVGTRRPPPYEHLIKAAEVAVGRGETKRALRFLTAAVTRDPERFEAYAVAAHVLALRGRTKLAKDALADAIRRAPADKRKALETLRDELAAATSEVTFQRHLEAGYLALERNLPDRAARELLAAFRIKPARGDLGLEAATALMTIQNWGEAHAVVRLVAKGTDAARRKEAEEILAYLEPIIAATYRKQVDAATEALETDRRRARTLLGDAVATAPDRPDAYRILARLELREGRPDHAAIALRSAVERSWLDRKGLLDDPQWRKLAENAAFRALVRDTFGTRGLERLAQPIDVPEAIASKKVITNGIGMRLGLVPAGRFSMGSPRGEPGRTGACEQIHAVTLTRSFYLGVTEVTQAQWKAVMPGNPSPHQGDDLPVQRVSWREAAEFCRRLTEREGVMYRLPTEAEWEYACRAGSRARYACGDDPAALGRLAWFKGHEPPPAAPQPVGGLEPNGWGFYDMHGNVYEWCADHFAPHSADAVTDPDGPPSGLERVARGGAWTSSEHTTRSAHRAHFKPNRAAPNVGFRVVREIGRR